MEDKTQAAWVKNTAKDRLLLALWNPLRSSLSPLSYIFLPSAPEFVRLLLHNVHQQCHKHLDGKATGSPLVSRAGPTAGQWESV